MSTGILFDSGASAGERLQRGVLGKASGPGPGSGSAVMLGARGPRGTTQGFRFLPL